MIRISRLADYAVVLLASIEAGESNLISAALLSRRTGIGEATVCKIMKRLARGDLVSSVRGAAGGYELAMTLDEITVADIVMAVDGPISLTACVESSDTACGYACHCPVKGRWDDVNAAIKGALQSVSLADMLRADPVYRKFEQETDTIKGNIHEHL